LTLHELRQTRARQKNVTATNRREPSMEKERGKRRVLSRSCYLSFQSLRMVLSPDYGIADAMVKMTNK
jgi:hypothetical protein